VPSGLSLRRCAALRPTTTMDSRESRHGIAHLRSQRMTDSRGDCSWTRKRARCSRTRLFASQPSGTSPVHQERSDLRQGTQRGACRLRPDRRRCTPGGGARAARTCVRLRGGMRSETNPIRVCELLVGLPDVDACGPKSGECRGRYRRSTTPVDDPDARAPRQNAGHALTLWRAEGTVGDVTREGRFDRTGRPRT
jgi:hypothetical protein